jgi:UDP-glucose 4-epimerase
LELYRRVADLLGTAIEPEYKPELPGEAEATLADVSAARALGWEPRVDLDEGLRRSIDYIKREVMQNR